jgi:ABC-type amino acid transport substrate-binding protein
MTWPRLTFAAAVALMAAFALACGSNSNNAPASATRGAAADTTTVASTAAASPAGTAAPRTSPAATSASPAAAASAAGRFPDNSYMAVLQKKGKIVVGVKFDVPPMGALNPAVNKPEGFDVDIAKQIAKAIFGDENKVEFVEAITKNREPFLTEDKVDMVVATYTITDARKQIIDFSNPYYVAGQSILVRKDYTAINKLEDMNGKKVCTQQGSTSEQKVRSAVPQADLLTLATISECALALQDKRIDAVTTDDIQLVGISIKDPNTKLVGGVFTSEPYGIGMKQGRPEFVQFVNDQLAAMEKDGRWKSMYEKHLGKYSSISADEALQRAFATRQSGR